MGLIVLVVIGAVLGWLGSVVLQRESGRGILMCVAAGVAGSLVAGAFTGSISLLTAVDAMQLVWAALGAIAAIVLAHFVRARAVG